MTTLTLTPGDDGIAILSLSAGTRATPDFFTDLSAALDRFAGDDSQTGAILTGFPEQDLDAVLATSEAGLAAVEVSDGLRAQASVLRRMETMGKPVVAALSGPATGPGLELALACHYRIALTSQVRLGLPDIALGLLPTLGGSQRLTRMIGIEAAMPLLMDGIMMDAEAALGAGIVDALAMSDAAMMDAARAWLASGPSAGKPWDIRGFGVPGGAGPLAPFAASVFQANTSRLKAARACYPAPHALLSVIYEGTLVPFDRAIGIEADYAAEILTGKVAANLTRSALRHKAARAPAPARSAGTNVRKLGVLGAGMMGAGIANVAAATGIDVVLLDRSQEVAELALAKLRQARNREVSKGRLTAETAEAIVGRIRPTGDPATLEGADLIIEAVFENRTVKAAVTTKAAPMLAESGFFASNTSTLPITGLARNLARPDRFIGLHFFSPVDRMPLVEIITGRQTSPETLADARAFVTALGKTPIVVHDSPGFYTSRIFCSYIDEAMAMLAEGVSPALIENAARQAGFPAPPLAVTDEVSLDLQKMVIDQARADGLDNRFLRAHAAPVVEALCAAGRRGRKGGGGFYDYAEDGSKRLWPELASLFPARAEQPSAEDVGKRLLYIQAQESLRCLAEGVIDDTATADVGSVLGIGYPAWTGGALSVIETVGEVAFNADCKRFAANGAPRFAAPDAEPEYSAAVTAT
ncbi:Fatty acid oxidation complex subunit alpha (plasmid) [Paracoccaceae bacterium]|nr:Fatty acid oxidation complex subunit alpha [Paracoccaceae bacterium]